MRISIHSGLAVALVLLPTVLFVVGPATPQEQGAKRNIAAAAVQTSDRQGQTDTTSYGDLCPLYFMGIFNDVYMHDCMNPSCRYPYNHVLGGSDHEHQLGCDAMQCREPIFSTRSDGAAGRSLPYAVTYFRQLRKKPLPPTDQMLARYAKARGFAKPGGSEHGAVPGAAFQLGTGTGKVHNDWEVTVEMNDEGDAQKKKNRYFRVLQVSHRQQPCQYFVLGFEIESTDKHLGKTTDKKMGSWPRSPTGTNVQRVYVTEIEVDNIIIPVELVSPVHEDA